jgi:hypothetical protein
MNSESCRLYLITPPRLDDLEGFAKLLEATLKAGDVACLQLRLKDVSDEEIRKAVRRLKPIVQDQEVAFILNDRPDLALETDCDGVHIGQDDTPYAKARQIMGQSASSELPVMTLATWLWRREKRGPIMSPSEPSTRPAPKRRKAKLILRLSPGGAQLPPSLAWRLAELQSKTPNPWSRPGRISSPFPPESGITPMAPSRRSRNLSGFSLAGKN